MRLLRAADRVAVPWKNGGGITREVAAFPPTAGMSDFGWRISIADVVSSGPFSRFEGVDRVLTLLEGELSLHFAEETRTEMLKPGRSLVFSGEAPIIGTPIGGPVRDLNVMVRRSAWQAHVELWRPELEADGPRIALATEPSRMLDKLDALMLDPGENPPRGFAGYLIRFDPIA